MRFRKSISICKGVKLNFSKSGVTATVGGKGISANVGKQGLYLNTSLPGTGIYDRKRPVNFNSIDALKKLTVNHAPPVDDVVEETTSANSTPDGDGP